MMTPYNRNNNFFSLFDELERSFFDSAFGNLSEKATFRTDIREQDGAYLLEAELPGYGKDNISIDLNGDTLTVTAKREDTAEEKDANGNYVRRERRFGSLQRSFDVSGIDTDNITADYENGILKLLLPQKGAVQATSRKIAIGGGGDKPFLEENNG